MTTRKFCFICGKITDKLVEGICEECSVNKHELIKVPKKFELTQCSRCMNIKLNNRWTETSVEDVLNKKVKTSGRITEFEIENEGKEWFVHAKGYPEGSSKLKEEKKKIPIHINRILCSNCIRRWGGYYEATIQIRGNYTSDVFDTVEGVIKRSEGKDEKAFISKIEKVRGGVDYYFGSKRLASQTADILKKKFNAEIKKSFELVTQKEGKDVHRNIFSVRI